jgi:Uma2 family endonuclease
MASHPTKVTSEPTWDGDAGPRSLDDSLDVPPIRVPVSAATAAGFRAWADSPDFPPFARISYCRDHLAIQLGAWHLNLPTRAFTFQGFGKWVWSPSFPRRGRIKLIGAEIIIDMSPEELETHNLVKTEVVSALAALNRKLDLGKLYSDGSLLRNEATGLSTEPDGMFVSWQAIESGRVRLLPHRRRRGRVREIEGAPDMVLEVISESSVRDDTVELRREYHRAGIREYWLIDARGEEIAFQVLQHRRTGYAAARHRGGWVHSKVFGRGFRLERRPDRMGYWQYTLRVEPA